MPQEEDAPLHRSTASQPGEGGARAGKEGLGENCL